MEKGLLIVVSGPAGTGKGTVNDILVATGEYVCSVSATTREPRANDVPGVTYNFISRKDFTDRIASDGMMEYTEYCGNFYGTPKKEAEEIMESGRNLILEIEVEGARNIKKKYPDAILIMLLPPSFAVQEKRLRDRGTDSEESIQKRLEQTRVEIENAELYDYVVFNRDGKANEAAEQIRAIIYAERAAMRRNIDAVKHYFS